MRCRYRVEGPNAGKTDTYGDFLFKDGVTEWMDRPDKDWNQLDRKYCRWYGCVRETDGGNHGGTPEKRPTEIFADGPAFEEEAPDAGVADVEAEDGPPWDEAPEGGGQERTEGSLTLVEAIDTLDPSVDEHWSTNGKPSVGYLRRATGDMILRAEVDKVAKWVTRNYLAAHTAEAR